MHLHSDSVSSGHNHDESHGHTHEHGNHPHTHGGQEPCTGTACDTCNGCSHTPREELMALMKYMVGHNAAHARDLAGLAKQLDEAGEHEAYEQVLQAVSDFEKGNLRLSTVMTAMEHERNA